MRRKITEADLPAPFATATARETPRVVRQPAGAALAVPPGFAVSLFADRLDVPRVIRVAPDGDVFVAESRAGAILRFRDGQRSTFADGLNSPFGIAFYPPGPDPRYVYVGTPDAILRYPYAGGPSETVVPHLGAETGFHWTRDIAFSPDGRRMYVSVGSSSNDAENLPGWDAQRIASWEAQHGLGAAWGYETGRADVLEFDPEGGHRRVYATGLRNCSALAVDPATGVPWCAVNERDGLGDNLPPDFATPVKEGAFYGWPWYYIGDHVDPRHKGERPDLSGKVTIPEVPIQAHSAPLGICFYDGTSFPAEYRGNAFVALHGSWNRHRRTGYKIVRIVPGTGVYEDFLTGFVVDDGRVWGRPVGLAVTKDGALLVGEDGNGTIWRAAYQGSSTPR